MSTKHQRLRVKRLVLDLDSYQVFLGKKQLFLRYKEFQLLTLLVQKKGRVLTKDFLAAALWKNDSLVTSNTLNAQVKNLRKKLGQKASLVKTVIGRGYTIED